MRMRSIYLTPSPSRDAEWCLSSTKCCACDSFAIARMCSIEDATLGHADLVALAKGREDVQKPNTAASYKSAARKFKVCPITNPGAEFTNARRW